MISVIIPIYNVENYLEECLNSLAAQSIQDIQFILVNDGSTDNSPIISQKFVSQNDKFILINKTNGGLMSTWLEGIKHVSGDYIGFVDSDDYVDKKLFEKLYSTAKEANADIVMCDRYDVFTNEKRINKSPINPGIYEGETLHIIRQRILPKISVPHITNARWNKIYKKELFLSQIKYCKSKSRFFEDRYIIPACMFAAEKIAYIDEPLYYYRQRFASNRIFASLKIYQSLKEIMNMQKTMLQSVNLYDKYYDDLIESHLDYLRQLTTRNVINNKNKKIRYQTLAIILKDNDFRKAYSTLKSQLPGKQKVLFNILYSTKSVRLTCAFLLFYDFAQKLKSNNNSKNLWP